ncbi:MBL fold metallo-hydrolase [bacterium]|nr:MBL fold metallo-hydrolase [bacterium]
MLVAILTLFFLSIITLLLLRIRTETKEMTILPTAEIIPGVFAIKDGYVNMFLIRGDTGYVAVDSGKSGDRIIRELASLGIRPEEVRAVLLTHSDYDHTGGIKKLPDADIYLSIPEEQMITGAVKRFFLKRNTLDATYGLLDDGQRLEIDGLSIECILAPGHTPGSMCYRITGRYLFCGDSLSIKNGRVGIFSDLLNMDSQSQRDALQKIGCLEGVDYVFTAHYGYSDRFREAFAAYRDCVYTSG